MSLILLHPGAASINCEDCAKWVYDLKTGQRLQHHGQDVPNPTVTPCRKDPKICPKGSPEARSELTPRNWQAYGFYLECKAVMQFPDDAIARRTAGIIRAVEDRVARS